jgi:DNA-binding transcriptional regulator YhcF (GntR family)
LSPGHKLPSTREIARRYKIHSNTVSAAYHRLLVQGWLELRSGSGLYVRPPLPSEADADQLNTMLTGLLRAARGYGYGAVAAPFCLLGDLKAKAAGTQEIRPN